MEKKMRIQYYDIDGRMVNDRLVSQDPEFNSGPKITTDGPIRIEFTLFDQQDIEKCKEYLDKVTGVLPLTVKEKKKSRVELTPDSSEEREEMINTMITQSDNQDILIDSLRNMGFKFMMWDFLKSFDFPIKIKETHQENYQWMIRCIKEAKNPMSDKYDPMLIVGFKMLERGDKIVVYIDGEFNKSHVLPVPDRNQLTFKKTGMMKFPPYMIEQEREKFRYEIRQYQNDPEKPFSKFFLRWREFVENVPVLTRVENLPTEE